MSAQIDQELQSTGVAHVIVVLKQDVGASASRATLTGLSAHFTTAPTSLETALILNRVQKETRRLFGAAVGATRAKAGQRRGPSGTSALKDAPQIAVAPLEPMRFFPNLGVAFGTVSREGLAALRAETDQVESVTGAPRLSLIAPRLVVPVSPRGNTTWGIKALKVPEVWERGFTGKGVRIGHLDTGVDGTHPAFGKGDAGRLAIASFERFDDFGRMVSPTPAAYDTATHGTHTAATIAGRRVSNGKKFFSMGVAPDAELFAAAVIEGGEAIARVLAGMDWSIGQGVRILSMSLGFRGWWEDFRPVVKVLIRRGILPVFAIGNEGPGTSRSPGNYPEVLSVGAVSLDGSVPDFSSSQRLLHPHERVVPDLVAPGAGVISAKPGGGYQASDGTSMATPHVAGIAALLLEAKPGATNTEVQAAIFQSCGLGPQMSVERANRGMPNALIALDILLGGRPPH